MFPSEDDFAIGGFTPDMSPKKEPSASTDAKPVVICRCPSCRSDDVQQFEKRKDNGVIGGGYHSWVEFSYMVCNSCGVVFQQSTVNKQIVEIMNHSSLELPQPEPKLNSEPQPIASTSSPAIGNTNVIGGFVLVPEHKRFIFEGMCPYCGGDLTYTACGWEKDDNGLWMADSFDSECSTMPDIEDEDEWDEWVKCHSEMPYVHQLPVEEAAKKYINSKYRFELKH